MHYLYKITNLINFKIYIGQTNDLRKRQYQYKYFSSHIDDTSVIHKSIFKNKWENFTFEVIATTKNLEDANYLEAILITQYDTLNKDIGYNILPGGKNHPRTEETRRKQSEGLKKFYAENDGWNKGGTLSEEWKINISIGSMGKLGTNTGKTFDNEWRLKISKAGEKPKEKNRKFTPEEELELCRLYIEEEKSTYRLEQEFETSRSTIQTILKRNNIPVRQSSYTGHKNNCNKFTPEEEIQICEEYKKGEISQSDLGRKYGCQSNTIAGILQRNGYKQY